MLLTILFNVVLLTSARGVGAFTVGRQGGNTQLSTSSVAAPRQQLQAFVSNDDRSGEQPHSFKMPESITQFVVCATMACTVLLSTSTAAWADGQTEKFKFPPIDNSNKDRCILNSSSMGQANAARDKLYDLRQCKLSGINAAGFDLSGVIMTETDASKANFKEAYFSKGFLRDSNFEGADFTNAIVDRASFKGSSLKGALFNNAVLTGTSFDGANVENADFTEAAIGEYDIKYLCKNPTLKGENPTTGMDTKLSVGCRN